MTAPDPGAPPPHSARQLLRSTLIAIAVAALILVTVVLPAEYGVDPTRVGQVLGLTEMGRIKQQLAAEAAAADSIEAAGGEAPAAGTPAPASPAAASAPGERSDTTVVVMAPTEAREVKLVMNKDARVSFAWTTDRGIVNYDTHGDRPGVRYHGYTKGQGAQTDSGSLTAAFDGQHGWFWRNRSNDTVRVTLRTRGAYDRIVHVQ